MSRLLILDTHVQLNAQQRSLLDHKHPPCFIFNINVKLTCWFLAEIVLLKMVEKHLSSHQKSGCVLVMFCSCVIETSQYSSHAFILYKITIEAIFSDLFSLFLLLKQLKHGINKIIFRSSGRGWEQVYWSIDSLTCRGRHKHMCLKPSRQNSPVMCWCSGVWSKAWRPVRRLVLPAEYLQTFMEIWWRSVEREMIQLLQLCDEVSV